MIYYVSVNGNDHAMGTKEAPFRTINHAASLAVAGDIVRVHGGEYREWVNPKNSGLSDTQRIVYEAVEGEHPIIKGSEIVTGWEHVEGTIWKKTLANSMFGEWNPYIQKIEGDWMVFPEGYDVHLGDVYIDGISMFEASSIEDLYTAEIRQNGSYDMGRNGETILDSAMSIYRWYALVNNDTTTIWCNFQDKNPEKCLIEINVRKCCFYPTASGLNYITLRGFEIAQAACPYIPPTADQIGMVGTHWSRGWIIENNHLHDAKCSAISIGKDDTTGDNLYTKFRRKAGYNYQMEAVFLALRNGWCKENIGSHIIRNNIIHDCGQNGVVGHMGGIFSRIEHNHIYNIAKKKEFFGHEIGGIKLHAAIDVVIENNNIHHCTLGIWLDWQAQGTRITKNIIHNNDRDIMIEVTHGPCLVDNNILLSPFALEDRAQGTALVHNIIAGFLFQRAVLDRATPYHFPHTTQVAGCTTVLGGDNRLMNNIFTGSHDISWRNTCEYFSNAYDKYSLPNEYFDLIRSFRRDGDIGTYLKVPQPVWIEDNVYAGYSKPFRTEKSVVTTEKITAEIDEINGEWILTLDIPNDVANAECRAVTTARLGMPRIVEEQYENMDGTPINFTEDFFGNVRKESVRCGAFAELSAGSQTFVVWK